MITISRVFSLITCPGGLCPRGSLCQGDPPPYTNVWAVRILLEYILVRFVFQLHLLLETWLYIETEWNALNPIILTLNPIILTKDYYNISKCII